MERNITLDIFKILLSILVITIHISPIFAINTLESWFIINGLARMAVPCFFIINGYYIAEKINKPELLKGYLLHLILIHLVWTLFYLFPYFKDYRIEGLMKQLIVGYYHLWYIPALITGVLLLFIAKKYIKNLNIILSIGLILFIAGYLFEHLVDQPGWLRNGIFMGFPIITIGHYIREKNLESIKNKYLIPIICLGFTALLIDSYFALCARFVRDFYLALPILCPALILLVLKGAKFSSSQNIFITNLSAMSSAIYFIHVYIIRDIVQIPAEYTIYKLPIILFLSIWMSIIIISINKRVRIFL